MTVAQLGLSVDSSSVVSATPALERMAAAAARAETAAGNLGRATGGTSGTMQRMLALVESIERDLTVLTNRTMESASAMNALTNATHRYGNAAGIAQMQSRNLMYQFVDIGQGLPLLFQSPTYGLINLGNQLSQIGQAYYGQGGFGAALRDMGGLLGRLLPILLPIGAAVGAIAAVFAGLTTKINETAKTHVSFGNVFIATIQVAAESIGKFFKPAVDHLGGWWQQFVDWITPTSKGVVNTIVGSFVFGFNAVKDTWSLLPDAFASIFTKAMNGAIDIVQNGINAIIGPVNGLLDKVGMSRVPLADLSQFKGTPSNADQKVGGIIAADAQSAFGTDYAGQAFGAISQRAQQLALADAATKAGKAAKGTSDILKGPLTDGIDKLTSKTSAFADAATGAFSNLGTTIVDAFKKGGNFALNILNSLLDKVGQFGESLLNTGLNSLLGNAVSSIFAPATGGTFGAGLWGSAIFGHNASGTDNWRGGMTWVGENGPELVNLPRGSQVIPNGPSMAMAANGNGGGITITNHIDARGATADAAPEIARQVTASLRQQLPDAIAKYNANPLRRAG